MYGKIKVTENELDELMAVIQEVWPEAFVPIIGQKQVDYMLKTYQSKTDSKRTDRRCVLLLLKSEEKTVGYTAYEEINGKIYLSKLYLLNKVRGQGLTSSVFRWYEELAAQTKERDLLRVNQGIIKQSRFISMKDLRLQKNLFQISVKDFKWSIIK